MAMVTLDSQGNLLYQLFPTNELNWNPVTNSYPDPIYSPMSGTEVMSSCTQKEVTDEEYWKLVEARTLRLNPPPTDLQLHQQSAFNLLAQTDTTLARIQEAILLGLTTNADANVVAWVNYRKALRVEVTASTVNAFPVKPAAYPTGT